MFMKILLLWLHFIILPVNMVKYEKSVVQVGWGGICSKTPMVLNDCNWCKCKKERYVCHARVCNDVDIYGHFNDVIREFDPGMGGHGSWRSRETACEPNVQYRRSNLLCVCNDDGNWPNPVCRDVFRILYLVEVTDISRVDRQVCKHGKLYLIGCNVCFCPEGGYLDKRLCTKRKCTEDDPVLAANESEEEIEKESEAIEIYAECRPEKIYTLGIRNCACLTHNRLLCDIPKEISPNHPSFCDDEKPEQIFSKDCNLCYCDKTGFAVCTTRKCLPTQKWTQKSFDNYVQSDDLFDEDTCIPGYSYKKECNICFCSLFFGRKTFACTVMKCEISYDPTESLHYGCVNGTTYELNCLRCHCDIINGVKMQICEVNAKCKSREILQKIVAEKVDALHGFCKPMHTYRSDCNTCKCLGDGNTVKCTSFICEDGSKSISVEIVPLEQAGMSCPKGLSYKIDCNYCFCLANGNSICTTVPCK